MNLPKSIQNLINELSKLPGIGPKTASRLAFYLLKQPPAELTNLANAVANLHNNIIYCSTCFNMAETDPCKTCSDHGRNKNLICVVEDPLDAQAMDQIQSFNGVFHILGGAISPLDGIGPDQLKIDQLLSRLSENNEPKEIILATNPSLEGEATAMFISRKIKDPKFAHIKVTRIGRGLPMGAELEYADETTLSKALEGRREF
ncbi:MAG: recombination protein RecR [Candidatus Doudnabacteria bacterium]|nr:recombination protein RecR [Candidatus Doudnabacteria bacterium]